MRKNIFLFIILASCFLLLASVTVSAQTAPPSADLQEIKEKLIETIASRVAELNLIEKRGFVGTVTDASNTQIALSDIKNNTRFIDVDELTKFSSRKAKGSFGISDITEGNTIGVIGLYNKESRRLLARFVNVLTLPRLIHGEVGEIDRTNRVFDVSGKNGETSKIDFLNSTVLRSYTKIDNLARVKFSAIQEGQRIIVVGSPDAKNKELITAERIILLPEIQSTTKVNETTSSATKSGKKTKQINQ